MRQSFPPLSPLLLPNSGHRQVDNYHDMFLGPIALSSETYFISQQENKDNGGGGDGAQYFIGLHFDEIASGCPAGELWARRPARKNNGLPTVHSKLFQHLFLWFKNSYFSLFLLHISRFQISIFLSFFWSHISLFQRLLCVPQQLHWLRFTWFAWEAWIEYKPSMQSSRSLQSFSLSLSTLFSSCGLSLRIFFHQFLERLGIVRQSWKE